MIGANTGQASGGGPSPDVVMKQIFTIGECDRRAGCELDAAAAASCSAERKGHLDRAAAFAHCSEIGRRQLPSGKIWYDLDSIPCWTDY